jgi:hypothetical protein
MRRVAGVLAILGVLVFVPAEPAAAHGGKVTLQVAGDGATGVTVRAVYQNDGHPVEDHDLRLTLTATGEGGRTVGPLDLAPAAEGRSFYSSPNVLTPGRWTVVVTSTDTNVLRAESTVDARTAQTAPTPTTTPAAGTASSSAYSSDLETSKSNGSGTLWTVAFVVALGLAAVVVIRTRRRR